MELLEQCQSWNDNDEYQKIIDALEAIPAGERTPEMDSELARAYNNIAQPGERALFEKAIALLKPHEAYFDGDHCWNFRMGYAWYYLDQEGLALHYFEQALAARPGDEDTQELIDDCRRRLALPRFEKNFRERTQEAWAAFARIEGELRAIMDSDTRRERGEELLELCTQALEAALSAPSIELGFNGKKYELILSAEGSRPGLFPLVYFQRHAPASVLEHWDILVGRQSAAGFSLRSGDMEVRAEDVQMWAEKTEDQQVHLVLFCEKLAPLLNEDMDRVWWALSMLMEQTIGEVSAIALIAGLDISAQPKEEPAMLLSQLPELVQSMGLSLWRDGSDYLENSYLSYELEPVKDPEADWRLDVYTGSSPSAGADQRVHERLVEHTPWMTTTGMASRLVSCAIRWMDSKGEDRAEQIFCGFRDALQEAILTLRRRGRRLPSWAGPPDCTAGIWTSLPGICPPCWTAARGLLRPTPMWL